MLRYLPGTINIGITLRLGSSKQKQDYFGTNWGGEYKVERRSQTGILLIYGNAPIYATNKLQKSVPFSSTETTYRAISDPYKLIAWIRKLLEEINIPRIFTIIR